MTSNFIKKTLKYSAIFVLSSLITTFAGIDVLVYSLEKAQVCKYQYSYGICDNPIGLIYLISATSFPIFIFLIYKKKINLMCKLFYIILGMFCGVFCYLLLEALLYKT